jgi:hypothetical protein
MMLLSVYASWRSLKAANARDLNVLAKVCREGGRERQREGREEKERDREVKKREGKRERERERERKRPRAVGKAKKRLAAYPPAGI